MSTHERFLHELTRERYARPVRGLDYTAMPAPEHVLAELVREVVPYRVDADDAAVFSEDVA